MQFSIFKLESTGSIVISIFIGFLLNVFPWGSGPWVPDFLLVILAFWVFQSPDKINLFTAFFLGVLMDIQTSQVMGIHSITYLIAAFLILIWTRRLLNTSLIGQTFIVFQVLLIAHAIEMLILWSSLPSNDLSFIYIVLPSLIASLFWPMVSKLFVGQTSNFSRNNS